MKVDWAFHIIFHSSQTLLEQNEPINVNCGTSLDNQFGNFKRLEGKIKEQWKGILVKVEFKHVSMGSGI